MRSLNKLVSNLVHTILRIANVIISVMPAKIGGAKKFGSYNAIGVMGNPFHNTVEYPQTWK